MNKKYVFHMSIIFGLALASQAMAMGRAPTHTIEGDIAPGVQFVTTYDPSRSIYGSQALYVTQKPTDDRCTDRVPAWGADVRVPKQVNIDLKPTIQNGHYKVEFALDSELISGYCQFELVQIRITVTQVTGREPGLCEQAAFILKSKQEEEKLSEKDPAPKKLIFTTVHDNKYNIPWASPLLLDSPDELKPYSDPMDAFGALSERYFDGDFDGRDPNSTGHWTVNIVPMPE